MDYLCELPNDAARRVALGSLPPDLNSTYERILNRVSQRNSETQKLVRRALRWITNDAGAISFTIEVLCEAVSIDLGSTKRNHDAIPDEFEILRWCSSLVRKSTDGNKLELSHFTVKEFLTHIGSSQNTSIRAYRTDPSRDRLILAKVFLTYLNFEDFDQGGPLSQDEVLRRFHEYPFRYYAINCRGWAWLARENLDDPELFSLMQKLFSPSKPNTFISFMHDESPLGVLGKEEALRILNSGVAEATALHYAAMYDLGRLCSWLIRSGCDVNRKTIFGTPLHFALFGTENLAYKFGDPLEYSSRRPVNNSINGSANNAVDLLLESGADPNCYYEASTGNLSPLFIALSIGNWDVAVRLLDSGGILDSNCLGVLEDGLESEDICKIVEHTTKHNLQPENHGRLLQLALGAKSSNVTRLMHKEKDLPSHKMHHEQTLRTAAEFGQVEILIGLLEDHELDINAADRDTGFTALHHAAKTDQLGVAQTLIHRGADSSGSDSLGRTALHHSVQGREARCLQYLLEQDADTSLRDLEGMTVWHRAAEEGNIQALSILLSKPVDAASAIGLKANDGRTALLCASANGSTEAMRLLISAGGSLTETTSDGCSPLHCVAEFGSLEGVEYLIGQAIDPCAVTHDGSSAIHYAVRGGSENVAEIVRALIENGVDPCKAREDGCTPLHELVEMIKEKLYEYDENDETDETEPDHLFAASRILLKKLLEKSRLTSDLKLGSQLIYLACSRNFPLAHEVVSALLELDLDCNLPSPNGRTALMAAAESGNGAILNTLLLHGADPSITDSGLNALHCACFGNHKNILVRLRETSIDWNNKTTATIMGVPHTNVTALHIAAQFENSSVLEYLLKQDLMSNIDARINCGATPLFVAVYLRVPQNVALLLSNGADSTAVDKYGNSAIHWAARYGFEQVISEFIRHGSNLGLPDRIGLTPELVARKMGHEALARTIMNYVDEHSKSRHSTPMILGI